MSLKSILVCSVGVMAGLLTSCSYVEPSINVKNQKSDLDGGASATIAKNPASTKGMDAGLVKTEDAIRPIEVDAGRIDTSIRLSEDAGKVDTKGTKDSQVALRDSSQALRDSSQPDLLTIDTKIIKPICTPETNAELCNRLGKTCGIATAIDNCNTNRTGVSCGTCTGNDVCTNQVCISTGSTGGIARPSTSTGVGFFVSDGKLYDPKGNEFRIRGVNKCHYDADWPGIPKTHSNTIRWVAPVWLPEALKTIIEDSIALNIVPMPGVWFTSGAWSSEESVTCKDEPSYLKTAVDLWVARAAMMKPFEKHVLVNIANEWGPGDSTIWRDSYIEAVARMRSAGYLGTLVVDSGGCGQDPLDIIKYAQAVFDSDPQRNILFDVHIYGGWYNDGSNDGRNDLKPTLDRLAATKLPIIIGEFGPGRDIGASPTRLTPGEIITASEERGMGWLAWAWDDPAWNGTDEDFTMAFNRDYNKSSDLTIFGKDVVENPTYGLLKLARPATSF